MVDRITPQTTDDDRAELVRRFGIEDRWPVLCEPFTQWVLEENFGDGRPPLEDAGVKTRPRRRAVRADEAAPAQRRPPGAVLSGLPRRLPLGARGDCRPAVRAVPSRLHAQRSHPDPEAGPRRRPAELRATNSSSRFANPEVRDTVARLCANTSDLIPKFLLPVVRAQLAAGRSIIRSVAVIAFWARYAEGVDERGERYAIDDALEPRLRAAAARQRARSNRVPRRQPQPVR